MELSVKLNGEYKTVTAVYATTPDFDFIEQWRGALGTDQHPYRRDSVEFAELAKYKFVANKDLQPYVGSLEEFQEHITNNPHVEVACMVYLKCDWYPGCQTIGLSHFRRTWTNRIVLDYLCAHPFVTKAARDSKCVVNGAGVALLYFVAHVAKEYGCDMIWGEATQNSCGFYKHVLKLNDVRDLIIAPKEQYLAFCDKMDKAWAYPEPSEVLEELYKVEEDHPPFVGNRTSVHSASHTLVIHFLELSFDKQREVAAALDFAPPNPIESDSDLFRHILQHAKDSGKVADLWKAVESLHPMGVPESNPFVAK